MPRPGSRWWWRSPRRDCSSSTSATPKSSGSCSTSWPWWSSRWSGLRHRMNCRCNVLREAVRNLSLMPTSDERNKREMKHLSDQELMRLVQAGDMSPASEIYDRYSSRIYNFAYRFLRNSEAAEDATQEVFVKMLKHANQFHGDAKLSTWLFSITANWCRDYLRKADNKAKEADDVLVTLPAPAELSPERTLEQRENEELIKRALQALTPE